MTQHLKPGNNSIILDWKSQPIPGKSLFNLNLGITFLDSKSIIESHEIGNGIIQIKNSSPMRVIYSENNESIYFKKIEESNYDWQTDLALLYFKKGYLKSITVYFNEPCSYKGLLFEKIGLGEEIISLKNFSNIEYDDVNEIFYALNNETSIGLELYGASCDLSIDPHQKLEAIKIFLVD